MVFFFSLRPFSLYHIGGIFFCISYASAYSVLPSYRWGFQLSMTKVVYLTIANIFCHSERQRRIDLLKRVSAIFNAYSIKNSNEIKLKNS